MHDLDAFQVFRTMLFIGVTVYTIITTLESLARAVALLAGRDPKRRLLRAYIGYNLVTFRLEPLTGELLQIAFWTTILLILWWLHTLLGA